MSQGFLALEPVTGSRTFGSLYAILRTNFQALQSAHSGTSWPTSPIGGQLCWRTDYSPRKLFIYNDLSSAWDEMVLATAGLGLELIAARGNHASLDARLDAQINEDGTFKASTASGLNPSQWYDLTVASGWVSSQSFKAMGANYTSVYHPTRRLKVNRDTGAYYTEVVSSSYGAPDTTVLTRDAVCGASQAAFRNVSHSIIAPNKAAGGDGAVSYEMVASRGITSGGGNLNIGDSVVFANGAGTTTLQTVGNYGVGRPIFLVNIGGAPHTFAAFSGQYINGASSLIVGPTQSVIIFNNGSTWYRLDVPTSLIAAVLSGTFTGTYTLGGTPTITGIADIYTTDFTDYSASSTIVGWASFSNKIIYYKKIGKLVYVAFYINGTSNATTVSFTLPHAHASAVAGAFMSPIMTMNSGSYSSGPGLLQFTGTTANASQTWNGLWSSWTATGSKAIQGNFWYQAEN